MDIKRCSKIQYFKKASFFALGANLFEWTAGFGYLLVYQNILCEKVKLSRLNYLNPIILEPSIKTYNFPLFMITGDIFDPPIFL